MLIDLNTLTTTVEKKDKGWEAKTIVPLPGIIEKDYRAGVEGPAPAQLEITTSKHYNGGISAHATVVYKTAYGFRHAISFGTDGDFSRPVMTDKAARCTEKKVREFHATALSHMDTILSAVMDHYGTNPLAEAA